MGPKSNDWRSLQEGEGTQRPWGEVQVRTEAAVGVMQLHTEDAQEGQRHQELDEAGRSLPWSCPWECGPADT